MARTIFLYLAPPPVGGGAVPSKTHRNLRNQRQRKQVFMQNKPNSRPFFHLSCAPISCAPKSLRKKLHFCRNPKTNPIQTQTNPILTRHEGEQTQTNPIWPFPDFSTPRPRALPGWLDYSCGFDDDRLHGHILHTRHDAGFNRPDFIDRVHTFDDLAEYGITRVLAGDVIETAVIDEIYEELARCAVGVISPRPCRVYSSGRYSPHF
jgi:hypothetical protein